MSNSKQLKKTESKKPENPTNSALGSDPDSLSINLEDIADLLKQLHNDVNGIRSELSVTCTQVESNSKEVNDLKHRNSELKDDINNMRGLIVNFYQLLLISKQMCTII